MIQVPILCSSLYGTHFLVIHAPWTMHDDTQSLVRLCALSEERETERERVELRLHGLSVMYTQPINCSTLLFWSLPLLVRKKYKLLISILQKNVTMMITRFFTKYM